VVVVPCQVEDSIHCQDSLEGVDGMLELDWTQGAIHAVVQNFCKVVAQQILM